MNPAEQGQTATCRVPYQQPLARVRRRLAEHDPGKFNEQILQIASRLGPGPKHLQSLVVKMDDRTILLPVSEVDWLEAAGNYVCVHTGKQNHIVRDSLSHFEMCLAPDRFARVHRSTVVNLDRIRELRPHWHGNYEIILRDGQVLPLSRRYHNTLIEKLGIQGSLA